MIPAHAAGVVAAIEREGAPATSRSLTIRSWQGWPVLRLGETAVVLSAETARRLAAELERAAG